MHSSFAELDNHTASCVIRKQCHLLHSCTEQRRTHRAVEREGQRDTHQPPEPGQRSWASTGTGTQHGDPTQEDGTTPSSGLRLDGRGRSIRRPLAYLSTGEALWHGHRKWMAVLPVSDIREFYRIVVVPSLRIQFLRGVKKIILISDVGFEVFTSVVMKSILFWDMMTCSLLSSNRRCGGTYRLHLQGRYVFSETSVATQQTTRRHIPEEDTLLNSRCL
jgi:hypothetical protein